MKSNTEELTERRDLAIFIRVLSGETYKGVAQDNNLHYSRIGKIVFSVARKLGSQSPELYRHHVTTQTVVHDTLYELTTRPLHLVDLREDKKAWIAAAENRMKALDDKNKYSRK